MSARAVRPLADRFWAKVDRRAENECWPWLGGKFADGYGAISIGGKPVRAPRASFELVNGPIPFGHVIRHSCDNPACVNPSHLSAGTQDENMADMALRGRAARNTKITDAQVLEIRGSDLPIANLAIKYGVSPALIAMIRSAAGYRVVPPGRSKRREKHHPA